MENTHPLIIVFYLDEEMMKVPEIIRPFAESINYMIEQKKANVMAFFLPTKDKERVECINPVQLSETDMEPINKLIKEIQEQFSVGVEIDIPEIENETTNEPCECGGNCKCEKNE
jgi:hypothetical protein